MPQDLTLNLLAMVGIVCSAEEGAEEPSVMRLEQSRVRLEKRRTEEGGEGEQWT